MVIMTKEWIVLGIAVVLAAGCSDPAGPSEPIGNANVHAFTIQFAPSNATLNGAVASSGYRVPEITAAVADQGAVLAYFRDQRTWTALPFTIGIENPDEALVDYTFTMGYAYEAEFLEIFIEASSPDEVVWSDIVDILQEEYTVKVVVIEGFWASEEQGLDVNDYESVKAWNGLRED